MPLTDRDKRTLRIGGIVVGVLLVGFLLFNVLGGGGEEPLPSVSAVPTDVLPPDDEPSLTPTIARQLAVPETTRGVVINAVDPSSDAGSKGLQRGDIVLSANYQDVSTPAELEAAIKAAKTQSRNAVLLRIQRRGQPATYVPIRIR